MPMRPITSVPATIAVSSALPDEPNDCAIANAGSATVAPGCTPALGLRRLSSSNAWENVPNANAAWGTCRLTPGMPGSRTGPPEPVVLACSSTICDQGKRAPNAAHPTASARQTRARSTTFSGKAS